MPKEKEAPKEPEGPKEDEGAERPRFRPAQAIPPIALMGVFIIVTVGLSLIVGPLYDSYGLSSGFEEFAQGDYWYLYAFGFVMMMVVVAVGILLLRKLLKRRKLKLKYLFAFVVFTSTFVVVQPFIDVAFNGAPPVWKEFYYDVDEVERAVPLDPADMGFGLIVVTNSSFHVLERKMYDYKEIGSIEGISDITDPHYNLGYWVISGIRDSDRIAWTIDKFGSIEERGAILHTNSTFHFIGVNIANVEETPYVLSFWEHEDLWSIGVNTLSPAFEFQEISYFDQNSGPLYPVSGWSFGNNYYWNETGVREISYTIRDLDSKEVVIRGGSYAGTMSIHWGKAEGNHALYWHNSTYVSQVKSNENLYVNNGDFATVIFSGKVISGYFCSYSYDKEEDGPFPDRSRTIVVRGSRMTVATQDSMYGEDYELTNSNTVAVYQESVDGKIWLVSTDGASTGPISTKDRGQIHIQIISFLIAATLVAALLIRPKWWLVDLGGLLMGAGVIAIMGISFPILFIMLLLVLLAVYDFISVYKTKHMIALADSVVEAKMPILLVFPMKWSYRYEDETNLMDPKRKRESLFMGLGDVIIPGIFILSIATFLDPVGGIRLFDLFYPPVAVAFFALAGMLVGWGSLMFFVLKGKAHAGLPPINSGTILGFIIGHLIIYGTIVFW
ncbi:MAG: hypothetical protein JXA22_08145 [Candidatus Thermoplasmatota archaeon]|nr:hypothetical protein [Candidatus Thermoplasmatota archaeon]